MSKYWSDRKVAEHFEVARTTPWRWAKEIEDFPKPRKVGPNTSRWVADEILAYGERKSGVASC